MKKLRHIFEYLIYKLFTAFLRLFSIDRSASICSFIARKIGPYLSVTNIARSNLEMVYGQDVGTELIIDELWDNFGRYIGEFPFIDDITDLDKRVQIIGLENIEEYKRTKQPYFFFLAHQANWDLLIKTVDKFYDKIAIVYRKANNPLVDKEIQEKRLKNNGILMIPKGAGGSKNIMQAIKNGTTILMLVDQKMNDGIEVPFFGKSAMTAPAIAKLSLQFRYPIVPMQIIREGRNSNFKLVIHKPIVEYSKEVEEEKLSGVEKDKKVYEIMKKINEIIESWVREQPGQWFWFHNRWKK